MRCGMKEFVIFLTLVCWCAGDISNNIYHKISIQKTNAACYRLLNGTHQFGCHSAKGDGKGVIVHFKSTEAAQLEDCFRSRFPRYRGYFFLLIDVEDLDGSIYKLIKDSKCISGVILIEARARTISNPSKRSHDSQCPNSASGFYADGCDANKWNDGAVIPNGLRNVDWTGINIIYLGNETQISTVLQCHNLFNNPEDGGNYPLCAASFDLTSSAAGNSEICIRRSKESAKLLNLNVDTSQEVCNALEGKSVIALLPPNKFNKVVNRSVSKYMMISGRVDSFGLIPEVSPSEISVLTSLIATLAMAKTIGIHYKTFETASEASRKYIILSLFNGEAFDYIGSSNLVYQMQNGRFPYDKQETSIPSLEQMNVDQIEVVLELQQIGVGDHFRIHVDDKQLHQVSQLVSDISSSIRDGVLHDPSQRIAGPDGGRRTPPASWHSFAKVNSKSLGVVLSSFDDSYSYSRINSILDSNTWDSSSKKVVTDKIVAAARALLFAASDYLEIPRSLRANLTIDQDFVDILFECFIKSSSFDCKFLSDLVPSQHSDIGYTRKNTYIGVNNNRLYIKYLHMVAIYATGTINNTANVKDAKTCSDLSNNQKVYAYTWLKDPITGAEHCYRHSVFLEDAVSPAFSIPDYDFKNSTYSTWTETVYEIDELKLYLLEKSSMEYIMLSLGILIALISYLIIGRCSDSTFIIDEGELAAEQGEPL